MENTLTDQMEISLDWDITLDWATPTKGGSVYNWIVCEQNHNLLMKKLVLYTV